MSEQIKVLGVIPARLASTRLTRKVLREIAGEPMVSWVYRAARACSRLDDVLIATDSAEVLSFAESRGYRATMTPAECASGTDRVYAVAQSIEADIYVNIQGDEPLLRPEHIDALLQPILADQNIEVSTVATPCPPEQIADPNAVKVVIANNGNALYFSRSTIPYDRDRQGSIMYMKHLGLYAYRKCALLRFPTLPHRNLENAERLEQLRLLENGIPISVAITPYDTIGVDTEDDLRRVENLLLARQTGSDR